jgi:two-component system CheB/CheR fusion protein
MAINKNIQTENQESNALPLTQDEACVIENTPSFPIIGIGASAGGLEAFEQFLRNVPTDNGMAFILVSHLDPDHASMLTEILQRITKMPVVEARDQMVIEPDHVYVIPPNRDMAILHGTLQLSTPELTRGMRMHIDFFFRSMAEDQREKAIGIILSGTGSDGTLGLRAILGNGGVSFVQEPSTAKYDGMPANAINNGLATYILPVEKMPQQLIHYVKTLLYQIVKPLPQMPGEVSALNKIIVLLRSRTGHDFSFYKKSTILRRIERRMTIHVIENMESYARFLRDNPDEVTNLFKELLINVTSFFRDKEAFELLKTEIIPRLFLNKPENYEFRIWVIGCATGEEAYSIAILLREYMDEIGQEFKVHIYATDIDEDAIIKARTGFYSPNIAIDITPEILKKFFKKEESGFKIRKDIREMVVFALQNVTRDPPFTKLDMVSCRNLLIYLEPELQKRVIIICHYALKPGGKLFLSPSESIGNTDLFSPINKKWKLYAAKTVYSPASSLLNGDMQWYEQVGKESVKVSSPKKEINIAELTQRELLKSAPASVVTDEKGGILYVHGETGKFLRPAPGNASLNIVEMAREGLQLELRHAILAACANKKEIVSKELVVGTNGGSQSVILTVKPLFATGAPVGLLLISFQEIKSNGKRTRANKTSGIHEAGRVEELEHELLDTKEILHNTVEELQASNEELMSINEEVQSTNEELQSTNEELETSKEELQSVNEELITVNDELTDKIEQLSGMENDVKNILENTHIGMIFLDKELLIRRFSPESVRIFRLVSSDIGRYFGDVKSNIEETDLVDDAREILDSFVPKEKVVQTINKDWYLVRILLYRTTETVVEGVVMTFIDITERKKADEVILARNYAENIVDAIREPLIVLDGDLKVITASRSFYQVFGVLPQDTVGCFIYDLGNRQWDIAKLRELLGNILTNNTKFDNIEIDHDFPGIGHKKMLLNARSLPMKGDKAQLILFVIEDITDKKQSEQIEKN